MLLAQALALPPKGGVISLVGGGGKTSLMLALARELAGDGARVVITTTTHILPPAPGEADVLLTDGSADTLRAAIAPGRVVCAGCPAPDGKLSRPSDALMRAARRADWLIVEADGSRRRPVKAPAEHEPRLFEPSDLVVAVAGLGALGRPLGEVCHRPGLAAALLDVPRGTALAPLLLACLLTSPRGQFKNVGSPAQFRVWLNQADDEYLAALGEETARRILGLLPGCRVVVGALWPEPRIKGVYHAHHSD